MERTQPEITVPEVPVLDLIVMAVIAITVISVFIWRTRRLRKAMRDLTQDSLLTSSQAPQYDFDLDTDSSSDR